MVFSSDLKSALYKKFLLMIVWEGISSKEELPKSWFFNLFEQTYFWTWIQIFACIWKCTFKWVGDRPAIILIDHSTTRDWRTLTVHLNPQAGIWKFLIKIIVHFVLLLFYSLAVTFLMGLMLLSNFKW